MASSPDSGFVPGLSPPDGMQSDPNAPNEIYPYLILSMVVCMTLTGTLIIIRCLTRALLMHKWGYEDWLLLTAYGFYIGYSSVLAAGRSIGAGMHQWDVDKSDVKRILFLNNVNEILYGFAITGLKVVLLWMYQRIFAPNKYSRRWWIIIVVMGLNIVFYFGLTFAKIFLCYPRYAIWDKSVKGKCGSLFGTLIASGIWNTTSDLVILFLPIIFVWKLKLTSQKRLALIAVFAIGTIAPIFSIVGIAMRVRLVESPDATYNQWRILLFAYAELSSGFICTCLPVLPRVQKWLKARFGKGTSSAGSYGAQYQPTSVRDRHRSAMARAGAGAAGNAYGAGAKDGLKSSSYYELTNVENSPRDSHGDDAQSGHKSSLFHGGDDTVAIPEPATITDIKATSKRGPAANITGAAGQIFGGGFARSKQDDASSSSYNGPAILKTTEVTVVQSDRVGYVPHSHSQSIPHTRGDDASDHSAETHVAPATIGSAV